MSSRNDPPCSIIKSKCESIRVIPNNGVVLPRHYNKAYDKNQHSLTKHQISYYRDTINDQQAYLYHKIDKEVDRTLFVNGLIRDKFTSTPVFRFDELSQLFIKTDEVELFKKIRDRLVNLKAVQNRMKKRKPISGSSSKKHTKSNITKEFQYNLTDYQVSHHFKKIYSNPSLLKNWNKWHYYSMFHSAFQSFSFVVYNYSHRLDNGEKIHRSTRLKLNFPALSNMLLIIHGRLVHSGSGSKYEHNHSYNQSHDIRFFSYLSDEPIDTKKPSTRASRHSARSALGSMYTGHLPEGEIDRRTFELCPIDCIHCMQSTLKKEMNLGCMIEERKRYAHTHLLPDEPVLICGDIDEFGWAVYRGIDLTLPRLQSGIDGDLRTIIEKKPKHMWHGIMNTERRSFKIDDYIVDQQSKALQDIGNISNLFYEIKSSILLKLPFLGPNVTFLKRSVIANFGKLGEQDPHRDFSSVRKEDP